MTKSERGREKDIERERERGRDGGERVRETVMSFEFETLNCQLAKWKSNESSIISNVGFSN